MAWVRNSLKLSRSASLPGGDPSNRTLVFLFLLTSHIVYYVKIAQQEAVKIILVFFYFFLFDKSFKGSERIFEVIIFTF